MKKTINDLLLESIIKKSNLPIIIDFWAIWCSPCKIFENIIKSISIKFKNKIKIIKINVDYNYYSCEKYSIKNIPTIIIIKNKILIKKKNGIINKEYIIKIIKKLI